MSRYKRPLRLCMSNEILMSPYYEESVRGHTITAKKLTKSMNSHQKAQEYIKGKSPLFILLIEKKKVKIMIFSVCRPQYSIFHSKYQRSPL